MRFFIYYFSFLILLGSLAACTLPSSSLKKQNQTSEKWVEQKLQELSLEEKLAQLVMPAIHLDGEKGLEEAKAIVRKYSVGGYHFLLDAKKLRDSKELKNYIQEIQQISKVPLLIAADFEGGAGFYFFDKTRVPRGMLLGASRNPKYAYQSAFVSGLEAKGLGVNVNFYPDLDINSNCNNPIINIRSFGGTPELVTEMGLEYIKGLQDAGVLAVAKHFPGHGDTQMDSHLELPKLDLSLERLESFELRPFKAAIQNNVAGIMTAHVLLPEVSKQNYPATMSRELIDETLRQKWSYEGLVFTDALMMGGIAKHFSEEEAVVQSIKAGVDVLLYPKDVSNSINALSEAIQSGELSEIKIDESVRRILKAKHKLILSQEKHSQTTPEFKVNQASILQNAFTLISNKNNLLPLQLKPKQKILVLNLSDASNWREGNPGESFVLELKKEIQGLEEIRVSQIDLQPSSGQVKFSQALDFAKNADVVFVNGFIRVSAFQGSIELSQEQINLVNAIFDKYSNKSIFVMFGNPYFLTRFNNISSSVLAYENYPQAEAEIVKGLLGEYEFKGKLPVELSSDFIFGYKCSSNTRI